MKTKFLSITFAYLIFTIPSYADQCFDLWVERNTIFKNNGYCFGSTLGKTYFGNNGCHTKNAKLSASENRLVAKLKKAEKALGCRINTKQSFNGQSNQSTNRVVTIEESAPENRSYRCKASCLNLDNSFGNQHVDIDFTVHANADNVYVISDEAHRKICSNNGWTTRFFSPSCY